MAKHERQVVIVGASAAGLRCAARLARLEPGWRLTLVEEQESYSYAACGLPYALSGDVPGADELRKSADGALRDSAYFAAIKGVTVRNRARAVSVDTAKHVLVLAGGESIPFDDLVLATGARPKRLPGQPNHPRVHTFHSLGDLEPLLSALKARRIRSVLVVGAGLCGCELAEAFAANWGAKVTLLEAAAQPLGMMLDLEVGAWVSQALAQNEVEVRTATRVEALEVSEDAVTVHAGGARLTADAVVVALGVRPAVELAKSAGVALGPTGAIAVSDQLATSVPHVWACGDCIEVRHAVSGKACHLPLGSLANRQGRLLADILAGGSERLPPVAGAMGLKVFDTNVAAAGMTRAVARAQGLRVRSAWWTGYDRAHYYPEAREIALHLVYEPDGQRVVGVQAVGPGEVHKRIDIAAQLLVRGARLADLAAVEHAYAPPYAPAVEPLAVLAWVAQNQERGLEVVAPLADLAGEHLLDVRHAQESAARPASAAEVRLLPQEAVRANAATLDGGDWLVVCEHGTRSAEVARWLATRGIHARYLGGGLRWHAHMPG